MSELTPRQREILKLIQESVADSGMPPTRAEIAEAFGFKSPNAAEEHLRALQKKGVIDLIPGASRGIQLKEQAGPSSRRNMSRRGIRSIRRSSSLRRTTY
jgi:repressor LexA